MKQKTVMADEPVWLWLKEHRGAGSMSDLIQDLIDEHESKKPGLKSKKLEMGEFTEEDKAKMWAAFQKVWKAEKEKTGT